MKQIVQNLRTGQLELLEVPAPRAAAGQLLIRSQTSLISPGTERSLVEFGRASLVQKARQNPDRVRQVWQKIQSDGLMTTLEAVFHKLDEPLPLGYSNAGTVVQVGPGVTGYSPGQRVVSNGGHAQLVSVPVNLCAKIPDGVSDETASFAVLGAIALQGIRLMNPQLGETVAVFGLGLVGLLTVQLLRAAGVRVIGLDVNPQRLGLAQRFGAVVLDPAGTADLATAARNLTGQQGVDGVLITASAKNDDIVHQSAQMCRKRGRIVLVGVVNLELTRDDFYKKELTFQVSCSYGPGRYDPVYEQQGIDYPYPYVRWTEQRNIAAVLDLMASGQLEIESLISHRYPFDQALAAYDEITKGGASLGVVLEYDQQIPLDQTVVQRSQPQRVDPAGSAVVGLIGAGAFTKSVLLPALARTGAVLHTIASSGGISAAHLARKYSFHRCTADYHQILNDEQINTVFITTRHHQHATMVVQALEAGKHVFVEKPLAIDAHGLSAVRQAFQQTTGQHLMVGFNRRFSPHTARIRQLLQSRTGPLCMTMLVNAGSIPADHWIHDPQVGGGRIIGEVCHWIDLLSFLAGAPVVGTQAASVGDLPAVNTRNDHVAILLQFADGSIGTIQYFANGHRSYPKEQLTVFCDGKVIALDNFRVTRGYGWSGFSRFKTLRQDKGHRSECQQFVDRVSHGGQPLIPPEQLWNVTQVSLDCEALVRSQCPESSFSPIERQKAEE